MSHQANIDIIENMLPELGMWEMRKEEAKERGDWNAVDTCRRKIKQILDAGHRIEGYTTTK